MIIRDQRRRNILYVLDEKKPRRASIQKDGSIIISKKTASPVDIKKYDRFVTEKNNGNILTSLKKFTSYLGASYYSKSSPLWIKALSHILAPGPNIVTGKSILDVGCSTGVFLEKLPDRWIKRGVEVNTEACKIGRKKGLEIQNSTLEEYATADKFDIIRASHVIEHTPNAHKFVKKISTLSKPSALILIYTPNADSFSRKIFGSDWEGFYDDTHFTIFNNKSLKELFRKYGFSLVSSDSYYMGYMISSVFRFMGLRDNRFFYKIYPVLYLLFLPTILLHLLSPSFFQGGGLFMVFKRNKKAEPKE